MMDIKVNVDGMLRDVCGINENTSCEEIIFKLAQVASYPGYYTLVAKFHDKEITLPPEEKILNVLKSITQTGSDVRLSLRRLEALSPYNHKLSHRTRPDSKSRHPSTSTDAKNVSHNPVKPVPVKGYAQYSDPPQMVEKNHDVDQYNLLKDQLANQEQQVELNRIRLLRLDKEISHLEQNLNSNLRSSRESISESSTGSVAELAQLTTTPWSQLLDTNRIRERELLCECERHKIAIDQVNSNLARTKLTLEQSETEISKGLNQLLTDIESYNQTKRAMLTSLQKFNKSPGNPLDPSNMDGVAV